MKYALKKQLNNSVILILEMIIPNQKWHWIICAFVQYTAWAPIKNNSILRLTSKSSPKS